MFEPLILEIPRYDLKSFILEPGDPDTDPVDPDSDPDHPDSVDPDPDHPDPVDFDTVALNSCSDDDNDSSTRSYQSDNRC